MTEIVARPPQGASVDESAFADIADATVRIEWVEGGALQLTFDATLTDAQCAAVRRRIVSAGPAEEAQRAELEVFVADAQPGQEILVALTRLVLGLGQPPP